MKTKPVLGEVMFVCIQAGRTGGFVCFSSRGLFFKQSLWRVFFFKKKFLLLLLYNIYIYIFWSSKIVNTFAFQSFQDGKSSGDVLCAFSMCYFHQLENSKGTFGYIIYCTSIYA